MRALLLLTIVLFASQVACAPHHIERLPLTHSELHELETQARQAHPHASLTARDLHPLTPVLLAELDDSDSGSIPAFIVERQVAVNMIEADPDTDSDMNMESAAEPEHHMDADDRDHIQNVEDEDDDALIESEFETSQFGGGYGKKGGFGYGSKKIPYKKVPYKKVPYKKVPFKKGPPKKKLPPKKFGGKKGGFGFGGFGYGGFGGGHH